MSDTPTNTPPDERPDSGLEGIVPAQVADDDRARRAGSMTLRETDQGAGSAMDPANQSLADAVGITFRFLQFFMILIGVLYLFSGVQSIREGQTGIRLLFGKIVASDLSPGFQFSFPRPIGDLIKVDQGTLTLDEYAFWPMSSEGAGATVEKLPATQSLQPATDGSLITADVNIAHTKVQIIYRRSNAASWARNVFEQDETAMVRGAVERGMVHALAVTPIDSFYKPGAGELGSVERLATAQAQQMLDDLQSGITVESLTLTERIPPKAAIASFNKVTLAASQAGKARDEAAADANRTLASTAGSAHSFLSELIDLYEVAVETRDDGEADRILAQINSALEGEPIPYGDGVIRVTGSLSQMIGEARSHASQTLNSRAAMKTLFEAKLEQYETSPLAMVQRDWIDAYLTFLENNPTVERLYTPGAARALQLVISRDPTVMRLKQQTIKRARLDRAIEERERLQRGMGSRIETGVIPDSR